MCKKLIQVDGLNSCLDEEGAVARFGTYLTRSKQDTRYNANLVFVRLGFISFSVYIIVLLSLVILILKIRMKDTVKAYFCYRHMLL